MRHALLWKRTTFDSAHQLPLYQGPCARLHGHTYTVELGLYLPIDETSGMALDFKKMNEFLKMDVLARFDHRFLNDITELGMSPTAEVLAHEILKDALAFFKCPVRVRLWETPDSWVEVGSDGLS